MGRPWAICAAWGPAAGETRASGGKKGPGVSKKWLQLPRQLPKAAIPSKPSPAAFAAVRTFWVLVPDLTPRQLTKVSRARAPKASGLWEPEGRPTKPEK